ncbi:MAG: hemolysin family protein [Bacilli bacterium]|jgi:CBS domain containing-hemolysin-like protein|nr:hemolysin family protein [Bacilli bacterium]
MEVPLCIVLIILVILSGFFSAAETAYTSSSHVRIERLALSKKSAKIALYLVDHYERLLSSILIGNNVVNIASASIFTILAIEWFGEANGPLFSTLILTVIILIFGEVTPKNVAKAAPEKLALLFAYPSVFFYFLFWPLTIFFEWMTSFVVWLFRLEKEDPVLTEDELKMIVEDVKEDGVIDQEEHDLIQKSIVFDDKLVEKVMTPWDKAVMVNTSMSDFEIKNIFEVNNYSRVPYLDGETGQVLGFLLQKDFYEMLIEKNTNIESLIKDPLSIVAGTTIADAFALIQKQHQQIALIVDKENKPIGILSMEDILEELVGEIEDEYDAEDEEEGKYYKEAMKEKEKTTKKTKKAINKTNR